MWLPSDEPNRLIETLEQLRCGNLKTVDEDTVGDLLPLAIVSDVTGSTYALDVVFQISSPAGRQRIAHRFVDDGNGKSDEDALKQWVAKHEAIFAFRNISLSITRVIRWELPSQEELETLAALAKFELPTHLLRSSHRTAVACFRKGDIHGAASTFQASLTNDDNPSTRNNLAFCQILLGEIPEALVNVTKALGGEEEPLFALNKGIAEFLVGRASDAVETLRKALAWIDDPERNINVWGTLYVLVLDSHHKVTPHAKFPLDAAVLIALANTGGTSPEMVDQRLRRFHPKKADEWRAFMRREE